MSSPDHALAALARTLRDAPTFEAGADALLEALRALVEREVGGPESVARGLVHLRSNTSGYRALVARDWSGHPDTTQVAPSATVWGLVDSARGAVGVDLSTAIGTRLEDGTEVATSMAYVGGEAGGSVQAMLAREATHLVAIPLRARGPAGGMACVEVSMPSSIALPWKDGPWRRDVDAIADVVGPLLLALPLAEIAAPARPAHPLLPVVGATMEPLVRLLDVFASQDETLLLTGPTGAGKSRLAQYAHARSPRRDRAFETTNLLAVPEATQMAELFGWRRGAFTGAHADHDGVLAAADGGTLFLDEIDKLSLGAQAGLLRVLETRRYSPLGAARERQADVRFIVGTNADLAALVETGAFRRDLYYRVNVLPLRVPGLEERHDEIPAWASAFLDRRHDDSGLGGTARFEPGALDLLARQRWPGNLRQLDNVVRRAYAVGLASRGPVRAFEDLLVGEPSLAVALALEGAARAPAPAGASVSDALEAAAQAIVEHALAARRAGATLGLNDLDVLRGAVLRAATARVGSVKDAFLLFGADALVSGRNHTATYKKALADLEAFEAQIRARAG